MRSEMKTATKSDTEGLQTFNGHVEENKPAMETQEVDQKGKSRRGEGRLKKTKKVECNWPNC